MKRAAKAIFAAVLAAFSSALPAYSQANFPQVMPADTVYGSQYVSGPGVAIPFATLAQRLFNAQVPFVSGIPQVGYVPQATSPTTASWAPARIKLTAPLLLFSDAVFGTNQVGCGLAPGSSACNRLNYLFNNILVPNYDTAGQPVTLNVANNDPGGLGIGTGWTGGGPITVTGPVAGCAAPTVNLSSAGAAVSVNTVLPSTLTIDCLTLTGQYGIFVGAPAVVHPGRLNFGAMTAAHMTAGATGAAIVCQNNYTISGSAALHYQANANATIICAGLTVTITGTPSFSAFADAEFNGLLSTPAMTFSGSATGLRYFANLNGVINTGGGGPNYFPGNAGGVTQNGGQYQ